MFLSRGDRDLGVAFQTHPGRQAFISSGSKEPRSALEWRRVSLGAHWVDSRESSLLRRLERGRASGTQTATMTLTLPKERRRGSTELNVQLTPSLGAVALDALPYLADYPYGCIEQTMSRFLPSVVVAHTLTELGVDLKDLQKRAAAYAAESDASKGSQARA